MQSIVEAITKAQHIVVIQADNPDADSLGSALALEHILGDLGKKVTLYCGMNVPDYLRYLSGWDRVVDSLPAQFDASIIVDASTLTLLEKLGQSGQLAWVKAKPCVVLDHHATVEHKIEFTSLQLVDAEAASTGEIIYQMSKKSDWPISAIAADNLMASILGDTQGLTNDLTKAQTYRTMADLCELGGDRPKLEELRREYGKMPEKIYRYKGQLIAKTEFVVNGKVAIAHIPQAEINEYSPLYNPAPLIQFDMLQVRGVALAIVFKTYDDGRVTAALRANNGYPIAAKIAEQLEGGGHDYAAGFKVTDGRSYEDIKSACISTAQSLLDSTDIA
ncbi:DHH family phosphoesterase [Candidatus Saccharibacteria bacterium]|nr:DHH family phosphoesterase [Candidatus Saccharibacteria bacterium]